MSATETSKSIVEGLKWAALIIVILVGVAYAILGGDFQPAIDWATPYVNKILDKL